MRLVWGLLLSTALLAADDPNAPTPEFKALESSFHDPGQGWQALLPGGRLDQFQSQDYGRFPTRPFDWQTPVVVTLDPDEPAKLRVEPFQNRAGGAQPAIATNQDSRTANLVSKESFSDLEVYLEFAVPQRSNAGVCLMGNYEIQLFDSFGKPDAELRYSDSGGIYAFPGKKGRWGGQPPRTNASRPAGEWQSLRIWFHAPRYGADGKKIVNARFVKIELNGVEIHRDYELMKSTRAREPWPERAAAPLLLQGDHGPAAYRNVYVRPLER